jgi:hypothetical protein
VAAPVLQARVSENTLARIDQVRGDDTCSAWLQRLIDRELAGQPAGVAVDNDNTAPAASPLGAIGMGEPSPGVVCMGPGCWQRDTSRFGLRRLPLCPACHAALEGRTYQRDTAERRTAHAPRRSLTSHH